MKPLPSAPHTKEDIEIWRQVLWMEWESGSMAQLWISFLENSLASDRRDAEKMYARMEAQAAGQANGYDWRTERRGWFPSDWGRASDEYLNPL
jgi:hypothetical protein